MARQSPDRLMKAQRESGYRCSAGSIEGFLKGAVNYLVHRYYFYHYGVIPRQKDPRATDAKIIEQYGLNLSKWQRHRRFQQGIAKVQYLRFGHAFCIALGSLDRNLMLLTPPLPGH